MSTAQPYTESVLEWAWAGRALSAMEGETESGDAHVVAPFEMGALVAVIDGLGHGTEAAIAARVAVRILESNAGNSVVKLVQMCHEGLKKTRGAVMTLASFNAMESSLTWVGVGNVEGILLRNNAAAAPGRQGILLRGGVVGYQLPPLHATTIDVNKGDTLIVTTDGIRSNFIAGLRLTSNTKEMADSILARHSKDSDDALVVVVRYLGVNL